MKIKNTLIEYATYKEFTISKNWESKPEQHSFAVKLVQSCIILLHLIRLTKGQNNQGTRYFHEEKKDIVYYQNHRNTTFAYFLYACNVVGIFFWYVFFILKKIMGESFWIHSIRNVKPDECL